ncbi:hypothetical protein [Tahibacter caeni]|uniref:hypothetical protein n=1 Tax=Tahibacter caeni TaxID=1453545 RepID=UPI0021487CA3|nr:hypothetical protein [Tahibacter caeni]
MTFRLFPLLVALGLAVVASNAGADTLLMERTQKESSMSMPTRGMSMAQVESRYGAPLAKLDPRGGGKPQHPVINRWEYDNFIVYFERSHVIDSVAKRAGSTEIGPKSRH